MMQNIEMHMKPNSKLISNREYQNIKKNLLRLKHNNLLSKTLRNLLEEKRRSLNLITGTLGNKIFLFRTNKIKNLFLEIRLISKSDKVLTNLLEIFWKIKILKKFLSTTKINKILKRKEKIPKKEGKNKSLIKKVLFKKGFFKTKSNL